MKYIIEKRHIDDLVFKYIEKTLKSWNLRPLDEKKHEGWSGYTNDFCEQYGTFLWGFKTDDIKKDYINIYYWGLGFDKNGIEEFFNLEHKQSYNYIKEYIQQYYDKEIILC